MPTDSYDLIRQYLVCIKILKLKGIEPETKWFLLKNIWLMAFPSGSQLKLVLLKI